MKRYKLCAEFGADIFNLMKLVVGPGLYIIRPVACVWAQIEGQMLPDCVLTFDSELDLFELQIACRCIPDGHVMVQTVALEDDFTGHRDFGVDVSMPGGPWMTDDGALMSQGN